ncbi:MAG TPA: hypothetical protein DDY59_06555 [Lachnospiraceae bacterium]|jgi:hypothetical protein|nr:hypothetical protein [Lachnospiraceae bacterium]
MNVKKSKFRLILFLILFKIALDISYVYIISPSYSYAGFSLNIDYIRLIESYLFVVLLSLTVNSKIDRPSNFLIWMLLVGSIIPTLSFYALHSGNRLYTYMIIISYLLIYIISKLPLMKISILKQGYKIGFSFIFILLIAVSVWLISRGGLQQLSFGFTDIYKHRENMDAIINVGIWSYINIWVFKVINPALIGWSLWKKKYLYLCVFVLLQIIFFGISAHKSVLFIALLILILYFVLNMKNMINWASLGLVIMIAISSMVYKLCDNIWLASLFIRRVFFVPAQLNYAYYELFHNIGHVYLSNSIFAHFIKYPFQYPTPLMVGNYLLGITDTWANNGFLGTSYMHFGFWGMIVFSFIVGVLVWLVDILIYNRLPLWLGLSIIVMPFFSLFTSSDLFTSLLTHGIIICLLILWLLGNKSRKENKP